jgi:phosphate transport system permease protein
VLLVLAGIIGSMLYGGWPAFQEFGFGFITSSVWDVQNDRYGAWVAIVGTVTSAFIALLIGVPISLGIAVFLTQLCPPWLKRPVATTIELLAAVPSIIYGMWGLFVFAPLFAQFVQIPVSQLVEGLPVFGTILYARVPSGVGVLTAGIILAIMIIPFIASITRDILDQIPSVLRESAYGVGCTTWEVVRHVLVPQAWRVDHRRGDARARPGARRDHGGDLRGRQRERLSASVFDPGSTIASRIANEFNEASGCSSTRCWRSAAFSSSSTFTVLVIARLLIARVKTH